MNDMTEIQVIKVEAFSNRRKLSTYKPSSPKKITNCAQSTGSRRNRRTSLIINDRINRPNGAKHKPSARSSQLGRAGRCEGIRPCSRLKVVRKIRRESQLVTSCSSSTLE